ncbi:MAG: AAA family ATPase [Nitrosospira sp.]|nr:AAA family ATPase [Nitrosospira sp.]
MKLEEIRICNFKGLKEARFQPMDFACLVGENNAGKSSVLQAIVTSLNRPSHIPPSLFYMPMNYFQPHLLKFIEINDIRS